MKDEGERGKGEGGRGKGEGGRGKDEGRRGKDEGRRVKMRAGMRVDVKKEKQELNGKEAGSSTSSSPPRAEQNHTELPVSQRDQTSRSVLELVRSLGTTAFRAPPPPLIIESRAIRRKPMGWKGVSKGNGWKGPERWSGRLGPL